MKESRFIVNPFQLVVSLSTTVLSAVLAVTTFLLKGTTVSIIFTLITLLFLMISLSHGSVISIGPDGISRSVLGKVIKTLRWDQIVEVGVAGSKVFRQVNKKKTGTLYIYFSEKAMTEDERFQMMFNWPPKNKIYLQYKKPRIESIRAFWKKPVTRYNTGDLEL